MYITPEPFDVATMRDLPRMYPFATGILTVESVGGAATFIQPAVSLALGAINQTVRVGEGGGVGFNTLVFDPFIAFDHACTARVIVANAAINGWAGILYGDPWHGGAITGGLPPDPAGGAYMAALLNGRTPRIELWTSPGDGVTATTKLVGPALTSGLQRLRIDFRPGVQVVARGLSSRVDVLTQSTLALLPNALGLVSRYASVIAFSDGVAGGGSAIFAYLQALDYVGAAI